MSIGYVPKKRKLAKHQRRMRKKYKKFSCLTCAYGSTCIKRERRYTCVGVKLSNVEFCPNWIASIEAKKGRKVITIRDVKTPKKTTLTRQILKFFKH